MELYLDSVKFDEIEQANNLGFITGLTTTPTFMHREGIKDVDAAILKLSKMVSVLQIEALGDNAEQIVAEAKRLLTLGLDKNKTVFKIPISLEGAKACKMLTSEGFMVNIHLVYTIQQAYLAMCAGATYVCVLIGRGQDQGVDTLTLAAECVQMAEEYGFDSKIMFSSVRNLEHIRNAIDIGCHTITVPWSIMKNMCNNNLTDIGTKQFEDHTNLTMTKAKEVVTTENITISKDKTIGDALIQMTKNKLGAVIVVDGNNQIYRIFTDGDLRRMLSEDNGSLLTKKFTDVEPNTPVTVDADATLMEVSDILHQKKIDNIIVTNTDGIVGLIDIQDIV